MKYYKKSPAVLIMIFLFAFLIFNKQPIEAATKGTVYVSVEKFTLGQGYLVEPTAVEFTQGENYAQIFDRVMKQNGYTYHHTGTSLNTGAAYYLEYIDGADTRVLNIPNCIQSLPSYTDINNKIISPPTNETAAAYGNPYDETALKNQNKPAPLGEFAYNSMSGWYFFVNSKNPGVGFTSVEAADGDVVRFMFTLYGYGRDLGDDSQKESLSLPNRDAITKRLAVCNKNRPALIDAGKEKVLTNALSVASNLDSTQTAITSAYESLPSDTQISAWVTAYNNKIAANKVINSINALPGQVTLANQTAVTNARTAYNALSNEQKKLVSNYSRLVVAETQITAIKTYTPSKTTLKSIKKQGTKAALLTWKKVNGCSGYQVLMSTKKTGGYKVVKTIKKAKTVKFVKKGLKKKKTYYFKVRAYRTNAGISYYGADSGVKKIKMK